MPELLKKIKTLEKQSRLLEPNAEEREEVFQEVKKYTDAFLNKIDFERAYWKKEHNGAAITKLEVSDDPSDINSLLDLLKENLDTVGINPASGRYLGYIPGGGLYYSALGDYMADIFNKFAGMYFASPGAVRIENKMIQWLADLLEFPDTAAGNLSSGGSISNLVAITTARDAFNLKGRDFDKTVIYHTAQAHHCIDKSIRIAGVKECIRRSIPMDDKMRMSIPALEKQLQLDIKSGLKPWLVIATAGTTDVGAVDPLDKIAAIAKKYSLWFHVDAAYGGFFILTSKGKKLFKGIEQADSVVMDPHKGMFLPYGTGVIIVRDGKKLRESHTFEANYMVYDSTEQMSPAELSPELTKHFRGLRMWLPLMLMGLKPFKAALEEKLLLAKYFHQEIAKAGFETIMDPELSVVTYRYLPKKGDANAFNKKLMEEIQKEGKIYISSTSIDGNVVLRMAILSFRTHLDVIDEAIRELREKAQKLDK